MIPDSFGSVFPNLKIKFYAQLLTIAMCDAQCYQIFVYSKLICY